MEKEGEGGSSGEGAVGRAVGVTVMAVMGWGAGLGGRGGEGDGGGGQGGGGRRGILPPVGQPASQLIMVQVHQLQVGQGASQPANRVANTGWADRVNWGHPCLRLHVVPMEAKGYQGTHASSRRATPRGQL